VRNLLEELPPEVDRHDLRLLLDARIGGPGQYDGESANRLYLPLAGAACQVILVYDEGKLRTIERGPAFDEGAWRALVEEVMTSLLGGPLQVGRDVSFSSYRVEGWWRGDKSKIQILPPPETAPRASELMGQHPFILEFPLQVTNMWPITNSRRRREHRGYTLLLNILLQGQTNVLSRQSQYFWASVHRPPRRWQFNWLRRKLGLRVQGSAPFDILWVQEFFYLENMEVVRKAFSDSTAPVIQLVPANTYYAQFGHDGGPLKAPSDLDTSIFSYQSLSKEHRDKFDRALFWMDLASRHWNTSASSSFAALVSAAEALTTRPNAHKVACPECNGDIQHEVPGATERFRSFFETFAPGQSLRKRRTEMYTLRSGILHGSRLMEWDIGRAIGWDPPYANEDQLHRELWGLVQLAIRNWLKAAAAGEV